MTQTLKPADRIRDLNNINEDVSAMLKSAGLAMDSLSGRQASSQLNDAMDTTENAVTTPSAHQIFEGHVTDYYTKLQAVIARLRRQAYALEEAGIISAESVSLNTSTTMVKSNTTATSEAGRVTNGGMGNLDIGWLNSRGNKVAAEKEHEIMVEARTILHEVLGQEKVREEVQEVGEDG